MSEHRYALRVPDELWVEIARSASLNRRSINSEIVWRLSRTVDGGAVSYPSDWVAFEPAVPRPPETDNGPVVEGLASEVIEVEARKAAEVFQDVFVPRPFKPDFRPVPKPKGKR